MQGIDKLVAIVTTIEPINYWKQPLPSEWDSKIFDAALDLYKDTEDSRRLLVELLDRKSSHSLAIFSERMVSLGLTQQSQECLLIGLFVLSLTFESRETEESYKLFPLFHHAAQTTGFDASLIFEKALLKSPHFAKQYFERFLALSGEGKDLSNFGFCYDPIQSQGLVYLRVKKSRENKIDTQATNIAEHQVVQSVL